jgi:hypothetical protein
MQVQVTAAGTGRDPLDPEPWVTGGREESGAVLVQGDTPWNPRG